VRLSALTRNSRPAKTLRQRRQQRIRQLWREGGNAARTPVSDWLTRSGGGGGSGALSRTRSSANNNKLIK